MMGKMQRLKGQRFERHISNLYNEHFNWTTDEDIGGMEGLGGGLSQRYRLTGPDTYTSRLDRSFLGILDLQLLEDLNLSLGTYLSDADESRFDVVTAEAIQEDAVRWLGTENVIVVTLVPEVPVG